MCTVCIANPSNSKQGLHSGKDLQGTAQLPLTSVHARVPCALLLLDLLLCSVLSQLELQKLP